ncbi:MAG TPA: hypothetical protein VG818_03870 [Gemmatimonadaceae bacterium]|jgi:hypothetical protein|nr:hypothetical protein [Gemmatimonadaceae bacterium]
MTARRALQIIFGLSLAGTLFSGVLSYRELFQGLGGCPAPGAPGTILGYPACVYGFFMFVIVCVTSAFGLAAHGRTG